MPLSKLSIFSKDTDANEVVKGYEYQKLRALENWLYNKVNTIDEVIYCEYEEDIFQRNIEAASSKFTQLKLYGSKAFSFKSEEIVKAISNFFMLFVKGEYSFDQVQFVFETNTSIAGKYRDNDAELLQEWASNQDHPEESMLENWASKIKAIVTDYIQIEFPKRQQQQKSEAQSAMIEFDNLPEHVWIDFAKTIRWIFNNEDPSTAIEKTVSNIRTFIQALPFPSVGDKTDVVFSTLYYEVSEKMFQDDPENRCLTNERMASLILDLGNEADKQYKVAYEAWKGTTIIEHFNFAEFFELLHAAKHCRHSTYLKGHTAFWLQLLGLYVNSEITPEEYKQKAIYEYLWLTLRPEWLKEPEGTFKGNEASIRQYFGAIEKFDGHEAMEDHFNLLQLVRVSVLSNKCDIPIEETAEWLSTITSITKAKIECITNPSEKCYWLEVQASLYMDPLNVSGNGIELDKIFSNYEAIIALLPEARLYNVTRLNDRLNQLIAMFIQVGGEENMVEELEAFADKLLPFVTKRFGNHESAKVYRDRGISFLRSTQPAHFAKALNYFHRAKDLWLQDDTAEGYVLALLNIAQLYAGLHMDVAAKYYALSAAWFCIHHDPEKLARRITSAFGFLLFTDYKQGAWISALESFRYYARARADFDNKPPNPKDEMLMKSLVQVAGMIHLMPQVSLQLAGYIQYQKQQMGAFYAEFLEPLVQQYDTSLSGKDWRVHLQEKLDAPPINDIGAKRTIEWKAFGSTWKVSFTNDWLHNSVGEEYAAVLQVLLTELASSGTDLHFMRTTIDMELEISEEFKTPEQLPSHEKFKWKVFTKIVDDPDTDKIRFQMGSLVTGMKYLLRDVSMLSDDAFFKIVDNLFQKEALAEKTMTVNLYQRMVRGLFSETAFSATQRNVFQKELLPMELKEDPILAWNSGLSPLYSSEHSTKQISERYKNALKATHLTVEHLKSLPGYADWLRGLREKGWLDWQILLAMYNIVLSRKGNARIQGKYFPTEQAQQEAFMNAFETLRYQDESESYIEFSLDDFSGKEFEFHLGQTSHIVLHTLGLENRASFPNFPALRDFLNHRFKYGSDDVADLSPF